MAENQDIDIRNLPLDDVYPSKTNPRKRFDDIALAQMAESIKAKGVIQPIVVRLPHDRVRDGYEIVAGESRWRASKLAGKETIPAVIRELSDLAALEIQVDENAHRKDLHPLEEARGFKQLLDKSNEGDLVGLTVEDLANKVNKGKTYVYGALKLLDMCLLAQDAFYDERLGREAAVLIARIPGKQLQEQATKELIQGFERGEQMPFRQARNIIHSRYTLKLTLAKFDQHSTTILPEAGNCFSCPKRSGNSPELFADIESADVCTDPDCFSAKKLAHGNALISTGNVISGEDIKKVFPYGGTFPLSVEYAKLDDNYRPREGGFEEGYATLLGDNVPEPVTVVFESGHIEEVYLRSALAEKIEERIASGEIKRPEPAKTQPQGKSSWEIEKEKREKVMAEELESRIKLFEAIYKKLNRLPDSALPSQLIFSLIADKLFDSIDEQDMEILQAVYGASDQDPSDFRSQLTESEANIPNLTKLFCSLLAVQQVVPTWNYAGGGSVNPADNIDAILAGMKMHRADIINQNLKKPPNPSAAALAEENDAGENQDQVAEEIKTETIGDLSESEKKLAPGVEVWTVKDGKKVNTAAQTVEVKTPEKPAKTAVTPKSKKATKPKSAALPKKVADPAKFDAIKAKSLTKIAKAKVHKESANADVSKAAALAAETSEVSNV